MKVDIAAVMKYPLSTEKGIRLMEAENKLVFVVDRKATKADIKKALTDVYGLKVEKVNTQILKGRKRAYVKLSAETPAIDAASQFGMM